jgi:hypothetical protein
MKKWISPPINLLLTMTGLAFMGLAVWSVYNLRMTDIDQDSAQMTRVDIPDASALASPPLRNYAAIVDQPLFWEERKPYVPPKPVQVVEAKKEEVVPVDTTFPEGRLIGIVDMGSNKMAIMKDNEKSHYLKLEDQWGNWKLSSIDKDAIVFSLGSEDKPVELINDYKAPQMSKAATQMAKARAQQAKRLPAVAAAAKELPTGLPNKIENAKQAPVAAVPKAMTIKEALAARQRLIAERWRNKKK